LFGQLAYKDVMAVLKALLKAR